MLLRVSAVIFAVAMLAAFVWYSQINGQTLVPVALNNGALVMPGSKVGIVSVSPVAGAATSHVVSRVPQGGTLESSASPLDTLPFGVDSYGVHPWNEALAQVIRHHWYESEGWSTPEITERADHPTWAAVFSQMKVPRHSLAIEEWTADLDLVADWSKIFAEQESMVALSRPIMSLTSKSGPVFSAYQRPLGTWKPKASIAPRAEAIYIREAMKHLRSSESAVTTAQP